MQILAKKAKKVLKKLFISPAYKEKNPLLSYYLKESQKIARFIITLKRLKNIIRKDFYKFKNKAIGYSVIKKELYKKSSKNMLMQLIVDFKEKRKKVISNCYKELGHKGYKSTYKRVTTRFY